MTSPKLQREYDRIYPVPEPIQRAVVPPQRGINWGLIAVCLFVAAAWGFAVGVAVAYGVFQ